MVHTLIIDLIDEMHWFVNIFPSTALYTMIVCLRKTTNASVNSTYAHAVPPTPGYCRAFAFPVSPGGAAFANFALPGGRYKKNSPGIEST